jgi:hypothetical protein
MISESSDRLQRHSRRFAVRAGIATWMKRRAWPRVAITASLAASAAVGIICSIALRNWGVTVMWVRYPVCVAFAYATFLVCLGLLACRLARMLEQERDEIRRHSIRHQIRTDPARESWFDAVIDGVRESVHDGVDCSFRDPRAIPLCLVLLLSITVVLICIYFICVAPMLLAEVIAEGGLVAWLYRPKWRGLDLHWLPIALEQTGIPALVLMTTIVVAAISLHISAPRATSLAEAIQIFHAQRN